MHFLKALTAAIVGAIIVASSASAESSIGCDSSKPINSTVTADTCSIFNQEDTPGPQAYASAPGRRNPHKTRISGGAGN
jgi:hypothetical protein